ncbi:phosphotransferase [Deinococcus sp.]|uniref:phosphotransferase n=1 Tax=Deinococcus sp. TaxID=47478 RepID=UPI003B59857E
MTDVAVQILLHHLSAPLIARRSVLLPREALETAKLCAALNLNADVLHDGGAIFGVDNPLIRLEARDADLPDGWRWTTESTPPLPNARPWQTPGWYAGAWGRLRAVQPNGLFCQLSTSDLGAVLRAGEGKSAVFLKVGSQEEVRITRALADSQPELLPEVLDADPERGELLTCWGGETLEKVSEMRGWLAAAEALAGYHRSVGVADLPHHPFAELLERGEALLRDDTSLHGWGMNDEKIAALSAALPALKRLWRQVNALQLPDGPVHGDSHPMNALWDGQRARWFDWSEAATAHPFTDFGWFVGHPTRRNWRVHAAEPELSTRLAGTYLDALGLPGARAELAAALPLSFLQWATVYDARFRHWPEPRPRFAEFYLRWLLAELRTPSLS